MATAKLPVRTVQCHMPGLSRKTHNVNNQAGNTGTIKVDLLEKTFKTAVYRQGFGMTVNISRKAPQTHSTGLDDQRNKPDKRFTPCAPK